MIDAMRADGLDPDSEIIPDGIFRRIKDRAKPGNIVARKLSEIQAWIDSKGLAA